MARAETRTWLSLDRWAEIVGLSPIHFNGMDSNDLFGDTVCRDPWMQFAWQHADQVSREDLAYAIREAEQVIAGEVGYNLLPDWATEEIHRNSRPADPTVFNANGRNPRGLRKSIETNMNFVISGGIRANSVIEAGAAVVRSDDDGDGYQETMTVTVTTTVTDPDEIRVYYPGESGSDIWEVRPIKVSISGGVATITFKSWQLVDPDLQLAINPSAINADAGASYLTTVDVYRVYNDPQQQVQFLWEPTGFCTCGESTCQQCAFGTQYGCLMSRDNRLGIFTYAPASWDSENQVFDSAQFSVNRDPEKMILWYYSGWEDKKLARPRNDMDNYWEVAVAYYAAALLDRPTCGCSNVTEFVKRMRTDKTRQGDDGGFVVTASQIDNNFGTTEGALFAFRRTREPARRVGR